MIEHIRICSSINQLFKNNRRSMRKNNSPCILSHLNRTKSMKKIRQQKLDIFLKGILVIASFLVSETTKRQPGFLKTTDQLTTCHGPPTNQPTDHLPPTNRPPSKCTDHRLTDHRLIRNMRTRNFITF